MTCVHQDRVSGHTGTGILRWRCAVCGREETRRPIGNVAAEPASGKADPIEYQTKAQAIEGAYLAAGDAKQACDCLQCKLWGPKR